ncbi:MAG TPA: HAMP domain-containing sensor histidine kinase [Polyangiaceae bacterium]
MRPRRFGHPAHGRHLRAHFRGAPLHRRIFRSFGLAILLTVAAAGFVSHLVGPHGPARLLALTAAGAVLWVVSLGVARRLALPLHELTLVAREIGEGNLKSRARLRWREPGEVGVLAEAINEMASRIEKQLGDQRELVAAVSHEIRAPLSRLRVLTELLRARDVDPLTLSKLDRELVEIDSLVGDLLASSRLEFSLLTFHRLDAREIATEALDRAGFGPAQLDVRTDDTLFDGDPTLLARALANLLDNAARHGGGATNLVVRNAAAGTSRGLVAESPDGENATGTGDAIVFEVEDHGPGIPEAALPRLFEPFQRGQAERRGSTSLGLGLALVRRIADAHGGLAWAENRAEGGARVAIRIRRRHAGPSS